MKKIREFFRSELSTGILLVLATTTALVMKNSFLDTIYDYFLTVPAAVQIGSFSIHKPILLWINDGLMSIFFLFIGLEIKYEVLEGHLSCRQQIILPAIAALGGLITPAMIYSYINWHDAISMRGWAIPAATDIAFSLGVLSLLGKRVPQNLKTCLVAIAIIDDLAAIIIIAAFYTENLSLLSIVFSLIGVSILYLLNKNKVTSIAPYIVIGIFLWACVLKSGVHATLAGVILALFIPMRGKRKNSKVTPAKLLEQALQPWVTYFILPIFAFANAGVSLTQLSLQDVVQPITLGIILGLFLGKQIGVMLFTFISVKLKICRLPKSVSWQQYYGIALLTGIGFTMSLFIGTLAFEDVVHQDFVRLGVIIGSILSGFFGYLLLVTSTQVKATKRKIPEPSSSKPLL